MGIGRKRFDGTILKSWEDVDLHMKEIGEIDLKLRAIEADMNAKISDIKLAAELEAKRWLDRKEKLALEVKEFVEEHRDEIKGKSKILNFGSVGFRQSTQIIIRKAEAVLAALKERGMFNCIIVKESVSKEALKSYPDDVIAAVGAKKKVEDVFWLEPDYEKLKA